MAYDKYHEVAALDTIYGASVINGTARDRQINPNIEIYGGSVDIYISNKEAAPASKDDMTLSFAQTNVAGDAIFEHSPRFILFKQNQPTVSEIIISGMKLTPVS